MQLVIHPRAIADLDEHSAYIGVRDEDAARRFLLAARATFDRVSRRPRMGRRWQSLRRGQGEMRSIQITGFRNYLAFYQVNTERVTIVRVLHGAMDLRAAIEDS